MKLDTYIVNSFTENIAEGNPAGVVFLDVELPDEVLVQIAIDVGKSETAFIRKINSDQYGIRWFSPKKEMPICGHATMAAAKVVFALTDLSKLEFLYRSGSLKVRENSDKAISMTFPVDDFEELPIDSIYRSFFPNVPFKKVIYGTRTKKVVIILPDEIELNEIQPDFQKMRSSTGLFSNGIGVSKRCDKYDFESRYFNPWAGVDEDPITGSVHTLLVNYWKHELKKNNLVAYQSSQRPGSLFLEMEQDKVTISGKARIVMEGQLTLYEIS